MKLISEHMSTDGIYTAQVFMTNERTYVVHTYTNERPGRSATTNSLSEAEDIAEDFVLNA